MPIHTPKPSYGFQLIELLITLAIIATLTAISLPIYTHSIAGARRIEASLALTKLALALEHYYFQHDTYQGATWQNLNVTPIIANHHYQLSLEQLDKNNFLITAIPQDADKHCGVLTLDALGIKGIRGSGTIKECW